MSPVQSVARRRTGCLTPTALRAPATDHRAGRRPSGAARQPPGDARAGVERSLRLESRERPAGGPGLGDGVGPLPGAMARETIDALIKRGAKVQCNAKSLRLATAALLTSRRLSRPRTGASPSPIGAPAAPGRARFVDRSSIWTRRLDKINERDEAWWTYSTAEREKLAALGWWVEMGKRRPPPQPVYGQDEKRRKAATPRDDGLRLAISRHRKVHRPSGWDNTIRSDHCRRIPLLGSTALGRFEGSHLHMQSVGRRSFPLSRRAERWLLPPQLRKRLR